MAWFDPAWSKRKKITIDNTKVGGASHTSFPVLVSVTDADIKAAAQADGDDILFTSTDGTTKLDHELEKWDSGTGVLIAWVRVPTLSGSVDTDIYVYYGNPAATDQQNITGVWDTNFKMVQHMKDATTSTTLDSTSNNNDGTKKGANEPIEIAGIIGEAQDFDGTDDYDNCGSGASLGITGGSFALSCWINSSSAATFRRLLNQFDTGPDAFRFIFGFDSTVSKLRLVGTVTLVHTHGSSLQNGADHFLCAVYNGVNAFIYVDGALGTSGAYTPFSTGALPNTVIGASPTQAGTEFDGIIDEVRISNAIRSADWITTEYNNQNAPGTFYSVGAEEDQPGATLNRIGGVLDRTASGVLVRILTS